MMMSLKLMIQHAPDGSTLQIDGMLLSSAKVLVPECKYFIAADIEMDAVCQTQCSMDNVSCQTDYLARHLTSSMKLL